jgi:hypothetical protein
MIANITVHHRERHWARSRYRSGTMGPGGLERSQNEIPPLALSIVVASSCCPITMPSTPVARHPRIIRACTILAAASGCPRWCPPLPGTHPCRARPLHGKVRLPRGSPFLVPSSLLTHVPGTFLCWPCLGHLLPCACLLPSGPPGGRALLPPHPVPGLPET